MNNIKEKIEELKMVCKQRQMRLTPQRVAIYKALIETKSHPSAEMLYENLKNEIPELSLDTVYRNLATLEEMDLIFRVDSQLECARFDADKTPHHHFICTKCGAVYDVFDKIIDRQDYQTNFGIIKNVNIQFCGICNNCLE